MSPEAGGGRGGPSPFTPAMAMNLAATLTGLVVDAVVDSGVLSDRALRRAIRRLLAERLRREAARSAEERAGEERAMVEGPIAVAPEVPNAQHYEVPARFFEMVLGPRLKYSAGLWAPGVETLAEAEVEMMVATAARAGVEDGQAILDLGCGWGALALWLAETFPASRITAVSNAPAQKRFIEERAAGLGLSNVTVLTRDVNGIEGWRDLRGRFDRVLSVEMFEHARNHRALLRGVSRLLAPSGRLLVHVFAHRRWSYRFATGEAGDWMARHFFTGGTMPALDLFERRCGPELRLADRVWFDGGHYARTCEAWLANLDRDRDAVERVLAAGTGRARAPERLHRWRLFFLACAEMFAFGEGEEWGVTHQVFERAAAASS